jgi:hypothetical protein
MFLQLGRSMIAARTFSQSLIAARDAVRAVMEVCNTKIKSRTLSSAM